MQVAEAMQSLGCHPRDSAFKAGSIFRELGEMDRGGAVVFLLMEYPIWCLRRRRQPCSCPAGSCQCKRSEQRTRSDT